MIWRRTPKDTPSDRSFPAARRKASAPAAASPKPAVPHRSEPRLAAPAPPSGPPAAAAPTTSGGSRAEPRTPPRSGNKGEAVIGPSLRLVGEIEGGEDLLILGRVEGQLRFRSHRVRVGPTGRLRGDVFSRQVVVEGEVEGNLHASEQIVLRKTGKVQGDLVAPRVVLESGASFQGSVDMDPARPAEGREAPRRKKTAPPAGRSEKPPRQPVRPGHETSVPPGA